MKDLLLEKGDILYFFNDGATVTGFTIAEVVKVTPKYADIMFCGSVKRIERELRESNLGLFPGVPFASIQGGKWDKTKRLYIKTDEVVKLVEKCKVIGEIQKKIRGINNVFPSVSAKEFELSELENILSLLSDGFKFLEG